MGARATALSCTHAASAISSRWALAAGQVVSAPWGSAGRERGAGKTGPRACPAHPAHQACSVMFSGPHEPQGSGLRAT